MARVRAFANEPAAPAAAPVATVTTITPTEPADPWPFPTQTDIEEAEAAGIIKPAVAVAKPVAPAPKPAKPKVAKVVEVVEEAPVATTGPDLLLEMMVADFESAAAIVCEAKLEGRNGVLGALTEMELRVKVIKLALGAA